MNKTRSILLLLCSVLVLILIYSGIGLAKADSVIATIPVDRPVPMAFDSSNGNLYVATYCCEMTVSVISGQTNTVVGNPIPVGKSPLSIAFDSANRNLYVANRDDNSISNIWSI